MNESGVISQDGGMEVNLGSYYDNFTNTTTTWAYWLYLSKIRNANRYLTRGRYGDTMLGYFDPPKDPVWNGWDTNTGMYVIITTHSNGTNT